MGQLAARWLLTGAFIAAAAPLAGQVASAVVPDKNLKDKDLSKVEAPSARETAPAASATMETLAKKQRETTLAAMQGSIDKQRRSISGGMAASSSKQGVAADRSGAVPDNAPFFNLPPPSGAENASGAFAMPEPNIADVDCQPTPEADVAPVLEEAARREGLEPRLLTAMIQQESAFRPCAVSQKGAQGLMQLMPATVEELGVKDPFDIKENIDAGARFMKALLTRYGGNLEQALGAYNAGSGKVDAAGGVPPIPETSTYVSDILKKLREPAEPKAVNQ